MFELNPWRVEVNEISRGALRRGIVASGVCTLLFVASLTGSASATTPSVGSLIIANPEAGWVTAKVQQAQAQRTIDRVTSSSAAGEGASGAVRVFRPSGGAQETLGIELLDFPAGIPDLAAFSASSTCSHSNGTSVKSQGISEVANATAATCSLPVDSAGPSYGTVVEAAKGHYVMLLFAETRPNVPVNLSVSTLTSLLKEQYDAVPVSSSSSTVGDLLIALGAVVVVLAIGGVILRSRFSRRDEEVLAPATGFSAMWTPSSEPLPPTEVVKIVSSPTHADPPVVEYQTAFVPSELDEEDRLLSNEFKATPDEPVLVDAPPSPERLLGKSPGWYPDNADETEQSYWDGSSVTNKIHWEGDGWVEVELD